MKAGQIHSMGNAFDCAWIISLSTCSNDAVTNSNTIVGLHGLTNYDSSS